MGASPCPTIPQSAPRMPGKDRHLMLESVVEIETEDEAMVDIAAVFRAIDAMSPEERQKVLDYIQRQPAEPNQEPLKQRVPGLFPGIWMSDDFNAELPDSFWFGDKPRS
jgi:hypothetical protein